MTGYMEEIEGDKSSRVLMFVAFGTGHVGSVNQ